jgi:hypothetical protein
MLPERRPGTLLNVAAQYLLPKTQLTIGNEAGSWHAELRDADREPVADAKLRVVAFDVEKRWPMTDRVVTGTAPADAAYAAFGIRANTEGTTMSYPSGSVDIGPLQLHYRDGASAERIWRYAAGAPYSIALTPSTKLARNLRFTGEAACRGSVVSIEPGSPYTFEAPMAATGTAAYAGYVMMIFLDRTCKGILRSNIYFGPSQVTVATDAAVTDAAGRLGLRLPPAIAATQPELRAFYDGDNRAHRPSMAIRRTGPPIPDPSAQRP